MRRLLAAFLIAGVANLLGANGAPADEIPEKYRDMVSKGLTWLIKQQQKDGSWSGEHGQYPTAITSLAGIALLNERSTDSDGKYAENIRQALHWLIKRSQRGNHDGLIGDPTQPTEAGRYMFGHGYALLFLSRLYGEVEDAELRMRIRDVLIRGVKFSVDAQSTRGGWFYTSKMEGNDADEGAATVTQLHALREARNAGIAVPKASLQKALDYLKKSTTQTGGVVYSLGSTQTGGGRPALTAAALLCVVTGDGFQDPLVKRWFKYCHRTIPRDGGMRLGYDEFLHFYYAQAVYLLGDEGWQKMFPDNAPAEQLTWSDYRKTRFDYLQRTQQPDGSWKGTGFDMPVYMTATNLAVLQLDRTGRFQLSR